MPNFTDNAGSVQRRFVVFSFTKTVVNGDMKLGDKLTAEMPALLVKCNRAYLEAARKWGHKNVWTALPAYFQLTRAELAQAVNSVEGFLASSEVEVAPEDPTAYCRFRDFRDAWKAFAHQNGYQGGLNKTITTSLFRTPFEKYGVRIVKEEREFNGVARRDEWVVGVRLLLDSAAGFMG